MHQWLWKLNFSLKTFWQTIPDELNFYMSYNHMKEKTVFCMSELCEDTQSELMFTDRATLIMKAKLRTHQQLRSYIIQNRATFIRNLRSASN